MSVASKFIEAFKQASQSVERPEPEPGRWHDRWYQSLLPSSSGHTTNPTGPLHQVTAVNGDVDSRVTADIHSTRSQQALQLPHNKLSASSHLTNEVDISSTKSGNMSGPSTDEPIARPLLHVNNSLDDHFNENESNHEDPVPNNPDGGEEHNNGDSKERTLTSDGEQALTEAGPQPCENEEAGSPQVSPDTPYYPHQQPSLPKWHSHEQDCEVSSTLPEGDQIAHFSDKAFRKALREVEPTLSKQQQYYAWRNSFQAAYEEQPERATDHSLSRQGASSSDRNPPYLLGVPRFADIGGNDAMSNIDKRPPHIKPSDHDSIAFESRKEGFGRDVNESTTCNDDSEVQPSKPFSTHLKISTPTAPGADMAERERMLESSFSQALRALETDNAEHIARQNEVEGSDLQRLGRFSQQRKWDADDADGTDQRDAKQSPQNPTAMRGRQGSPDPEAACVESPTKVDDSFATAHESPDRSRSSDSERLRMVLAEMEEEARQNYAKHHDQAMEEESMEGESVGTSQRIPGLDHLNPPSSHGHPGTPVPAQAIIPQSPTPYPFNADVRKSIEPETPHHLLNRECTPAFEDRSPTPSPHAFSNGHRDTDVDMEQASSPRPTSEQHQPATWRPLQPAASDRHAHSSPDPISSPHHHAPSPQPEHPQGQTPATTADETTCSQPATKVSATKPIDSDPASASAAAARNMKSTKQRRTTTTTTTTTASSQKNRRKSAVQGGGVKIEKSRPLPKSRNAAEPIFTTVATTGAGGTELGGDSTTTSFSPSRRATAEKATKVKQAVDRIEKCVRQARKAKAGTASEMTPPTRRSRRLTMMLK